MSLMSFISKQFVDVIQWTDDEPDLLAYRYPMEDKEIQNGAQLVVRATQQVLFLNEGKVADKFTAGTYTLNTQTLPVLTYLKNWDKFFESPFKSDVYYFSLREQVDQKWGTTQPIALRDKEFGALRIRAFGNYSYKISDIELFWTKLCGTAEQYSVNDIEGQLRAVVLTALASFLGKSEVAFIDMAGNQDVFSQKLQEAVAPALKEYGLQLQSFYLQSLSLPEELQAHLDKASSMRIVGDLQKYTQFQAADSLQTAAANPGGLAGAGVGMGAGLAMGQMMGQTLGQGNASASASASVSAGTTPANPATQAPATEDPLQVIEKLGNLLQKGLLTQKEFDQKKAELLNRIK